MLLSVAVSGPESFISQILPLWLNSINMSRVSIFSFLFVCAFWFHAANTEFYCNFKINVALFWLSVTVVVEHDRDRHHCQIKRTPHSFFSEWKKTSSSPGVAWNRCISPWIISNGCLFISRQLVVHAYWNTSQTWRRRARWLMPAWYLVFAFLLRAHKKEHTMIDPKQSLGIDCRVFPLVFRCYFSTSRHIWLWFV